MTPAIRRLQQSARAVRTAAGPVPSPCVSVCRMNEATGLCEGCLRTLDEIAGWSRDCDEDRRGVWSRIEQRAAQA